MTCTNPYCRAGVCHGPRVPFPHPCKACLHRDNLPVLRMITKALVAIMGAPAVRGVVAFVRAA